jgi:O-succinylbenzoate synthase
VIDRIVLYDVEMPLHTPFAAAHGRMTKRRVTLVEILSGDHAGWGECGPIPGYSAASYESCREVLASAASHAIGAAPDDVTGVAIANGEARHALTAAAWDLVARRDGIPLWRLLGGIRPGIPAGAAIGLGTDPLGDVAALVAAGYRAAKVKLDPSADSVVLHEIRKRFPDLVLGADANGSFTLAERRLLDEIDAIGFDYLEQPLPAGDWDGQIALSRDLATPLALDESIASLGDVHRAIESGAAAILTLKPARLGGLDVLRSAHDAAVVAGVALRAGGMIETGVGRAFAFAAASLPGFTVPGDLGGSDRHWERDLIDPAWMIDDGVVALTGRFGTGVAIDQKRLAAVTVDTTVLAS